MDVSLLFASPTTWIILALFYLLYWYGTSTFSYFSDQGIPGPKPIPYVGNAWGIWKTNFPRHDREMVRKYGRVFGQFDGTKPNLYVTDAELIKSIFIKDFDHFINHREFKLTLKYVRKMITMARDQQWKDIRSSVSPAFTTGKIKKMSTIIAKCTERLVDKLYNVIENGGKLDAKKQFSAFTMDVVGRCAFGMVLDYADQEEHPFVKNSKSILNPPIFKSPLLLLAVMFPNLMNLFSERAMFGSMSYYLNILENVVKERRAANVKYNDFIDIASEVIAEQTREVNGKEVPMWTQEEVDEIVVAQSTIFLFAGFESSATTLANVLFMLSRHPEVQEKLHKEVMIKYETFGEVNHEMISDITYVDNVIHEVLRMHPSAHRIERLCNKDVTYNGIYIKKGTVVTVPSCALHYDEEYYPDPFTFNPDRWSPENDKKPNPSTFMAFAVGPRNCVGMRFAMEEMKIALCTVIKDFRFFPIAETPENLESDDGFSLVAQTKCPIIVGIESR